MKISNNTYILEERFGPVNAVRLNCEAGFEAVDYTMYKADGAVFRPGGITLAREMRRVAESYGACFNQTHAPFSLYSLGAENRDKNKKLFEVNALTAQAKEPIQENSTDEQEEKSET